MKDFNFHTAHLLHTVGGTLKEELGETGELAVQKGIAEYIETGKTDISAMGIIRKRNIVSKHKRIPVPIYEFKRDLYLS